MSHDEGRNPPAHWKAFLQDVDQLLQSAIELQCLGGFVLSVLYAVPRPTAGVDYIAAMPSTAITELETIAGRSSALYKKHGMYLQHVTIADVPEDFACSPWMSMTSCSRSSCATARSISKTPSSLPKRGG